MRSSRTPRESHIVDAIIKRLREIPNCVVRKRHGSAYGVSGDPDIYGLVLTGDGNPIHFEIEVKRPGEKPTPLQATRLYEWRRSGALAGVATTVEEALCILGMQQ